jgi:hypothetical protein
LYVEANVLLRDALVSHHSIDVLFAHTSLPALGMLRLPFWHCMPADGAEKRTSVCAVYGNHCRR